MGAFGDEDPKKQVNMYAFSCFGVMKSEQCWRKMTGGQKGMI